jgi:Outer membrane lipoprotein carrier protein LolA-like
MRLRLPASAALTFIGVASVCTAADPGGLEQVMHLLAMRQHGQVEFVEQQFVAILNHPVESSGILSYDAPDRLEKRTLKPHEESLVLAGGVLTVERGRSRRVLDLHSYPQALPFVESIRATLAGDRAALERVFRLDFSGDLAHWSLALVPSDPRMAKSVAEVRIEGTQDQLLKVEIRQPDGDHSLMTLRPLAAP